MNTNLKIGEILVENGNITQEELDIALAYKQEHAQMRIGDILVELGYITEDEKLKALSNRLNIPIYDKEEMNPLPEIASLVSEELANRLEIMPLDVVDNELIIAMHDPLNYYALEEIKSYSGLPVSTVISSKNKILSSIKKYYATSNIENALIDMQEEFSNYDTRFNLEKTKKNQKIIDKLNQINSNIDNTPLIKFIDNMIKQAYDSGASDIHIEPYEDEVLVRIRIDGVLKDFKKLNISIKQPLITRIKIMGGMNIAETRIPQDGRIDMQIDDDSVDIRVSTIPTIYGEKVVIRLLGNSTQKLENLNDLGLDISYINMLKELIAKPYGIILVTGPTGSGKTTSLYALLNEVKNERVNIVTVEDPVEKRIKGINQVQVNNMANLTFASGLRSILRQDPDIIMVGEIRDEETAEIAIRSAITGHLVLSTIHTNDTATAIARLKDMGIPSYLISASVVGIIAQRLVRRLCDDCKEMGVPTKQGMKLLNGYGGVIYRARGCEKCNYTGYKGRLPLFEVMKINNQIKNMISNDASIDEIRNIAIENGMSTLKNYMIELIKKGETTIDEFVRVVYND